MASIDKRPNGKWRARYRVEPGGSQRSKHFDRRTDAERFLTRIQGQVLDGSYVDPAAGRVTFEEYADSWRKAQVHRRSTFVQVDAHLRNHMLPTFGDRALASIRPSEVQAWVRGRTEVLAPATVETAFRIFSAILSDAVRDRLVAHNPAKNIRLAKKAKSAIVPPTVDQVEAVIAEMPDRYQALVTLAAGTGLRQGECFGLSIDRVDFLRRSINVDRQIVLAGSGPPEFGPPKTEASIRTVPLPQVVAEALAAHLKRFHDLRHFYASLLINHGESVKVVQARLGHASASETLDTYAHLWPDTEDHSRAAVDKVLGQAGNVERRSG